MTTFSQLVDALVAESRRPDMLAEIISYTNQTIRELHFDPKTGGAIMFRDNFREVLVTANVESGFCFNLPDPASWQGIQVVKYLQTEVYPSERIPSRALANLRDYYYRVGNGYVFSGYGGSGAQIAVGFFQYPRRLTYYIPSQRPAIYEADIGWTYADQFAPTPDLREAAQEFSSNWILLRWVDVIAEGIRAKIYKRVGDGDRAKTCYSLYMSLRQGLYTSETAILGGFS